MEGAKLMRDITKNFADWLGIERGAIGRDALKCQITIIQGCLQTLKKRFDIVMVRIVVEHFIHHPFVLPVVHRREHTVRAFVEFIHRCIARKCLKRPLQKRALNVTLRLFSPLSPPNFGSWQRGQIPGDHAIGANSQVGRASHLRPPPAPPDR